MIQAFPRRRVLTVMRRPVGGIRTYIGYNYPPLIEDGNRFTFVGPARRSQALFEELSVLHQDNAPSVRHWRKRVR